MTDPMSTLAALHAEVARLSPVFLAQPAEHAEDMRRKVAAYVAEAQRSTERPDESLLAPIAAALGALMQVEDKAQGNDW